MISPCGSGLAVELPDTLSDTHRCRHFPSSREPSVWLTGTRESIKEPDGAGVLIPPSPPAMSELNAHGVQKQVPTPNTFIRSHTAGRAPPPWTPGSCRCRRWNRRYHGPPRMAARTVSCTVPTTARGTSASCTPPGSGNAACFPRPARSATRDNAMAESSDGAYRTELVWRRKPSGILRDLELATFQWVSWRGPEASAPVLGLQDTGTDRNRVLCKPSGANRPTIRAEQKSAISNSMQIRFK